MGSQVYVWVIPGCDELSVTGSAVILLRAYQQRLVWCVEKMLYMIQRILLYA